MEKKKFKDTQSLDHSMIDTKRKSKRKSRKTLTNSAGGDQNNLELPQRVFLYLQPKSISFPSELDPFDKVEIELEHKKNKITKLSDHYKPHNIINVEEFDIEKPTFSITIEQDSIEDVTCIGDAPIVLTLYVYKFRKSGESLVEVSSNKDQENRETLIVERIPVAQGYIDILGYFKKKRSKSSETIYLYPLEISADALTCKTEWEIYSLHPLVKNTIFSNVVLLSLGSLYNINEHLMEDCENFVANLSFLSKIPNENNDYDKIFFCKYTEFTKSIISDQNLSKKWESLKNRDLNNLLSMGIAFDSNFTLSKLLYNLLATENVEFHYDDININLDYALICNSVHRYILTNNMQKILENALSLDQYQIIMEIYSERDESKILLQGFIDLSIFMYPQVKCCSYAIELKPPYPLQQISKATLNSEKRKNKKKSSVSSREHSIMEEKIPFAVVQICLYKPITNPIKDMTELSISDKCDQCSRMQPSTIPKMSVICEQNYFDFDNLVREILNHMISNNIKTISDDKEFFCAQLGNMTNKIMKLVACDFNIRIPTKTNIEFTNLMTTVYRELVDKIYECIKKCSVNGIKNCFIDRSKSQKMIITRMTSAKYMYEIGNIEMAEFFMNEIRDVYSNNPMFNFYNFLYDMERQNYQAAKEYLKRPLNEKDPEGQLFSDLVQIYLSYKLELQNPEEAETADENLIKALSEYCTQNCPKSLVGWILLNCLYKKYNYRAGMTYTRWKYENLYDNIFDQLEFIPISRWEIYLPYKITLKPVKDQNFIKVMYQLLCLGLYDFAEWVFNEIASECLEVEKYFILNTFKIFNNDLGTKFSTKNFPVEKIFNPLHLRANLSQLNGNLEYLRNTLSPNSMIHYKAIFDIKDLDCYHYYQLAILRYAYRMMDEKEYEEAGKAFLYCCDEQANCIAAVIGRGKSCYYLGKLEEAEQYFALSTKYEMYIPNTWAYLALINLKRGENYKALECWKYARLNPDNDIDQDILNELDQINPSDIFLYVDVPNPL